jgi:hypothetical protein
MTNKQLIQREANKYLRYRCVLDTIDPYEIGQFRMEVDQAFDRLPVNKYHWVYGEGEDYTVDHGLQIQWVDFEPYKDLEEMTKDIKDDRLRISKLHNDSLLLPEGLNLKFRAVNDYFHYLLQQPFDFKGELNVYKATKFLHKSDIGKRILYSEIVLQAAYCEYFGGFPEKQKVII